MYYVDNIRQSRLWDIRSALNIFCFWSACIPDWTFHNVGAAKCRFWGRKIGNRQVRSGSFEPMYDWYSQGRQRSSSVSNSTFSIVDNKPLGLTSLPRCSPRLQVACPPPPGSKWSSTNHLWTGGLGRACPRRSNPHSPGKAKQPTCHGPNFYNPPTSRSYFFSDRSNSTLNTIWNENISPSLIFTFVW